MGGSDQWGNITAGIELIRKVRAGKAHGLVTAADDHGVGREVRQDRSGHDLARRRAHAGQQEFRQFWLNTDDRDVIAYLKFFTFLTRDEIDDLEAQAKGAPEKRAAQQVLADQVTTLVHGAEDDAARSRPMRCCLARRRVAEVVDAAQLADSLLAIAGDVPSTAIAGERVRRRRPERGRSRGAGRPAESKSEARRLVQQGGVSVNDRKIADANARLVRADALDGRVFLLRKGSRQRFVIRLT